MNDDPVFSRLLGRLLLPEWEKGIEMGNRVMCFQVDADSSVSDQHNLYFLRSRNVEELAGSTDRNVVKIVYAFYMSVLARNQGDRVLLVPITNHKHTKRKAFCQYYIYYYENGHARKRISKHSSELKKFSVNLCENIMFSHLSNPIYLAYLLTIFFLDYFLKD